MIYILFILATIACSLLKDETGCLSVDYLNEVKLWILFKMNLMWLCIDIHQDFLTGHWVKDGSSIDQLMYPLRKVWNLLSRPLYYIANWYLFDGSASLIMIMNSDQLQSTKAYPAHWPPCIESRHTVRIIPPYQVPMANILANTCLPCHRIYHNRNRATWLSCPLLVQAE